MNIVKILPVVLCCFVASGCTTTPEKYKSKSGFAQKIQPARSLQGGTDGIIPSSRVDPGRLQAIASAAINVPQVYVDKRSGRTVELVVQSEYFSANGRVCRRFSEVKNGRGTPGISCQDGRGWTEISLSSFVR